MVSFSDVQSSNSRITTSLPPRLVAVFVGATSGIGETTLKQFARYARQPRAYFIGRSQEAGDRIVGECKALNSEGEYVFIKADVGLIRVVDDVCQDIKSREKAINILFLSTGTMVSFTETAEGLHLAMALAYHSRVRFIVNLLPLLQRATALRRVVTVFAGGKEGPINTNDFQALHSPMLSLRGHISSLITLSLEAVAKNAPDVSFVHDFPGAVQTGLLKDMKGILPLIITAVFWIIGPWVCIPIVECGERHLFLATSARYKPASTSGDAASGVHLADGVAVARGTSGEIGSGVYSVNWDGESSGLKVEELLVKFRKEEMVEQVWKHTEDEFQRITGPVEI